MAGRNLAIDLMRDVGLEVAIDAAGNIFGRKSGTEDLPPIMFGSHIDTVRAGGRFDGVLGVVAAIECIRALCASGTTTRHPLEAAIFANEEGQNYGALCGSRAVVGDINDEDLDRTDHQGQTLRHAIRYVGGNPEELHQAIRKAGSVAVYVELHIEQGRELETLGVPIGIVIGITGIQHIDIEISGVPNHSGTTAMSSRHDALVAASEIVLAVRRLALEERLCRVANVGRLLVSPNSINIVPGAVSMTVELRDLDAENIRAAIERLSGATAAIAVRYGVSCEFKPRSMVEPVLSDEALPAAIEASCSLLGLRSHRMPSGAGHDAQMMARIAPMGMIFVPSLGGISHSTDEFSSAEDCANGASVLLQTILVLDRSLDPPAMPSHTGVLQP